MINTFAPWSMWVLATLEVFDTTWFYVTGVVFTGTAVENLSIVLSFPAKK
jgi:hypothetical protein